MTRVVLTLLALALLAGCAATTNPTPTPATAIVPTGACHARTEAGQVLPDPTCTPGALNPAVTQADIRTTICVRGWTATERPPVSYTEPLKRRQIAQYGYTDRRLSTYEEDHLIPLELGGAPRDPRNLWPEPGDHPKPGVLNSKDLVENALRAAVCSGRVQLAAAQQAIATDWTTAEHVLGLK